MRLLADSSVWIDHFRKADAAFHSLLVRGKVRLHPMVFGELLCGNLPRRDETLLRLSLLENIPGARHDEVVNLVQNHRLQSSGIGWVDCHLLASCLVSQVPLLTHDKALNKIAHRLDIAFKPAK